MIRCLAFLVSLLALCSTTAFAQRQAIPIKDHATATGPDIVVEGILTGPFATKVDTNNGLAQESVESGQATADAQFFSKCITTRDGVDLRGVIDGIPNGNDRKIALDRLIRNKRPCYPNYVAEPPQAPPYYGDCNQRGHFEPVMAQLPHQNILDGTRVVYAICQAFYDRGALVERALALYAPDLRFTSEQLFDPAVLARFRAREDRFDVTRSKQERVFAEVAACLVAVHPNLALAYPKTPEGKAASRLRAALVGTAPQCVGGAKHVSVDPSQFRIFMADAIYSWAIALRGTDSLIPDSGTKGS